MVPRISTSSKSARSLSLFGSAAANIIRAVLLPVSRPTKYPYRYGARKQNIMSSPRLTPSSHYTLELFFACGLYFVLATTAACAQAGVKNYFPLADGAKWEYIGRVLPATGGQYPTRATIRIEGTTLIRGHRYYKYVTSGDFTGIPNAPTKLEQVRYYRAEANGIYFLPSNDLDGAERLAMPLPIPVGERWLSGSVEVTAERVGTVEAGGHKYANCLKLTYKQPGVPRTNEDYYAPGIGLIKTVYINATPPQSTIELTLESYHL